MKVVLFDLDGTLTDSAPGITACVQYALEKMGKPEEDVDKLRSFVGPPLKEQFMSFAGFSEEEAIEAVRYYRERYTKTGMFENSLYPGVEELLALLKDCGCVLAVASSKPEPFVRQILEHFKLTGYFKEIVGAGMDEKRTTKAEVIEETLTRLNMTSARQDVVMVGDRSYDVIGAHECGVQCIGVSYGYGSMDELINAGVTYVADSVEELEILAENGREEPKVEISSIDITELSKEQEKQKKKEQRRKKHKEKEAAEHEKYPITESIPKKFWRIVYPVLTHYGISTLISVLGTMAIMIVGMAILGIEDESDLMTLAMQQVMAITGLGGFVAIPVLALFFKADEKRRISGKYVLHKTPEKRVNQQIIFGMVMVGMGLSHILNDLISLSGLNELFPGYSQMGEQIYTGQSTVLMLVVAAVIAPIAEELLFRGLVQMRVRDYVGPIAGIIVSAVAFGIYHGNMIQFIYAGLLGLFLGLCMEKSQSLLVPIIGHVVANFWAMIGMTTLAAIIGDHKGLSAGVDIVMALIFISGLSLIGFTGKAKTEAVETKVSEPETETAAEVTEASVPETETAAEVTEASVPEIETETKAQETETVTEVPEAEIAAEPTETAEQEMLSDSEEITSLEEAKEK